MTRITEPSVEYAAHVERWGRYALAYQGGTEYAKECIQKHVREDKDEHADRAARAFPVSACTQVVDVRTSYLVRALRDPEGADALGPEWLSDVDMRGNDFRAFYSRAVTAAAVFGLAWIGVDQPRADAPMDRPRTVADDMRDEVRPYLQLYDPRAVIRWGVDWRGRLEYAMIRQDAADGGLQFSGDAPAVASKTSETYILWTRTEWIRLDKSGGVMERGEHPLGYVPLVPLRFAAPMDDCVMGPSLLAAIEPLNRSLIETWSLIDELCHVQVHSTLVIPEDTIHTLMSLRAQNTAAGAATPTAPTQVSVLLGPRRIIPFSGDKLPSYISPDASQLGALYEAVDRKMREILRHASLLRGAAVDDRGNAAASGVSKAFDFLDTNQALANQGQCAADALEFALWLAGRWRGVDADVKIAVPSDFGVESAADVWARFGALTLAQRDVPPALAAAYMRLGARMEFADDPELKGIEAQIGAEQFVEQGAPAGLGNE